MSATINDGGPAFPSEQGHTPDGLWNQTYATGMSLRDYFAAAALAPIVTSAIAARRSLDEEVAAHAAYIMADAMLRVREVKP
jgi:hypothetical protein